jgi:hypothetical protein
MRAGARCWVHGLKSSPQRNGQEVALTDGLALERYPCKLASGEALRLKPVNLTPRTTCSQCGAECEKLLNCAKCGVSAYCGKACQVSTLWAYATMGRKPGAAAGREGRERWWRGKSMAARPHVAHLGAQCGKGE